MEITTKAGHVILIDDADIVLLAGYSLSSHVDQKSNTRYAVARRKLDGIWVSTNLSRIILGLEKGNPLEAEHVIPGNGLDNRRSNLRPATRAQNNANRRLRRDNTSGYKGVSFYKGKWKAQIMHAGKAYVLGCYDTKEEAFKVYCEAAKRFHGEFARPERRADVGLLN